ncbi:superoxide dismutase [Saccharothrix coeruleofusca]|uniref:Cu-Zn family superoxide dismutase n=1 Tax=Saccharothrix coeruleofusca TaxID=33919 RepID=A0A918ALC0_9PSEU|nr:superoxide dismutase [Saccharothrix coeruleofusca]MBP2339606.1 Cu-Zn family superoxide dismutase [Saccharothrix coeruleofusca]GGP56529.1 hypothetical protein GCM10010185_30900 [Saccharothrix coeruleofusca]
MHLLMAFALAASFAPAPGELISYDERVPAGARATVMVLPVAGRTAVALRVTGLLPHRDYGTHAHVNPCGPKPEDAGPHYQNVPDPVSPSTDPSFANPRNEIWLDFTTDGRGRGIAHTVVPWQFTDRRANSIVLHAERTHTEPGHAGTAGARLGCLTVRF